MKRPEGVEAREEEKGEEGEEGEEARRRCWEEEESTVRLEEEEKEEDDVRLAPLFAAESVFGRIEEVDVERTEGVGFVSMTIVGMIHETVGGRIVEPAVRTSLDIIWKPFLSVISSLSTSLLLLLLA